MRALLASDGGGDAVEEVALPGEVISELRECLRGGGACLPLSARSFRGGWEVGLLERFEGGGG